MSIRHDHDPAWRRVGGACLSVTAPGLRIELADEVAALHREPQDAAPVEDRRVRVARRRIGHLVFDLSGLGIESPDQAGGVARYQILPSLSDTRPWGP